MQLLGCCWRSYIKLNYRLHLNENIFLHKNVCYALSFPYRSIMYKYSFHWL